MGRQVSCPRIRSGHECSCECPGSIVGEPVNSIPQKGPPCTKCGQVLLLPSVGDECTDSIRPQHVQLQPCEVLRKERVVCARIHGQHRVHCERLQVGYIARQ